MKTEKTTEELFTKTEKEYKKLDKLYETKRKLFDALKELESNGWYGSDKWNETFTKYADTFKACHGYKPHWAR